MEVFIEDIDKAEYKALSTVLAALEIFATCTMDGIYDKKLVYKLAHGYIDLTIRDWIDTLLEVKTEMQKNTFIRQPKIY